MVFFSKSAALAALAFLAASADAHMKMKTPTPYGASTLDNSPLIADGSDFPCKQRSGVYNAEGANNVAAIGEPQTLSFLGSAVHGGGSCQVSLTTDLQPTKNSKWMVIKSIEGGCPASVAGNLPADPNGTGASTFQFTIPEGIAPGQYTMAWTWFNKIGNREMYMNCAPMTVTGSKKKRYMPLPKVSKRQTSFPDMFVANLAGINDCKTTETFDYVFPNPGPVVQSAGTGPYTTLSCGAAGGNTTPQQPTGAAGGSGGSGGGGNGGGAAQATGSPTDSGVSVVPTEAPAAPTFAGGNNGGSGGNGNGGNNGQYTQQPGNFASGAASPTASADTSEPTTVTGGGDSSTGTSGTGSNSSGSTGTTGSTGSAGAMTGPCTDEGDWNCIDGNSFQRCASGQWSAVIALNGMKCTPGVSANIAMSAAKAKRHTHFHQRRMAHFDESHV